MHKVKSFDIKDKNLLRLCSNKKITAFACMVNKPLEENCVNITLEDETEIYIYSFMRVVGKNDLIFSITDFWVNDAIDVKEVGKSLIGLQIERVKYNKFGDITLFLSENKKIEIFIDQIIDQIENEPDYLRVYTDREYYVLCRVKDKLTIINGTW